ncbi:hypothetical protein [Citrobacter braakii]|nr:hypothetical protein [Citrobacter braakii]
MADFRATKRNASFKEWGEALECMVELNGKSFDITGANNGEVSRG